MSRAPTAVVAGGVMRSRQSCTVSTEPMLQRCTPDRPRLVLPPGALAAAARLPRRRPAPPAAPPLPPREPAAHSTRFDPITAPAAYAAAPVETPLQRSPAAQVATVAPRRKHVGMRAPHAAAFNRLAEARNVRFRFEPHATNPSSLHLTCSWPSICRCRCRATATEEPGERGEAGSRRLVSTRRRLRRSRAAASSTYTATPWRAHTQKPMRAGPRDSGGWQVGREAYGLQVASCCEALQRPRGPPAAASCRRAGSRPSARLPRGPAAPPRRPGWRPCRRTARGRLRGWTRAGSGRGRGSGADTPGRTGHVAWRVRPCRSPHGWGEKSCERQEQSRAVGAAQWSGCRACKACSKTIRSTHNPDTPWRGAGYSGAPREGQVS
jgi:hypothetical protein